MEFKIQWFPGHMTKARRMMEEQLKLIDVVVELLDARIPYSSTNPMLIEMLAHKYKVIALNKADMADPEKTEQWLELFKKNNIKAVKVDCSNGKGIKQLISTIQATAKPVLDKWLKKGVKNRSIRIMIVGVPNVGKSTLINKLVKKNKAIASNRPGVTRGQQWITIAKGLELLDTPGVLWPKFNNPEIGLRLAVTGAINEDVFDREIAVYLLMEVLIREYSKLLSEKYNILISETDDVTSVMEKIGLKRGCLRNGGLLDKDKIVRLLLHDFKTGKMGRFTLDNLNDKEELEN